MNNGNWQQFLVRASKFIQWSFGLGLAYIAVVQVLPALEAPHREPLLILLIVFSIASLIVFAHDIRRPNNPH